MKTQGYLHLDIVTSCRASMSYVPRCLEEIQTFHVESFHRKRYFTTFFWVEKNEVITVGVFQAELPLFLKSDC